MVAHPFNLAGVLLRTIEFMALQVILVCTFPTLLITTIRIRVGIAISLRVLRSLTVTLAFGDLTLSAAPP